MMVGRKFNHIFSKRGGTVDAGQPLLDWIAVGLEEIGVCHLSRPFAEMIVLSHFGGEWGDCRSCYCG